jgi:Tfp pilus assembly protein PilO
MNLDALRARFMAWYAAHTPWERRLIAGVGIALGAGLLLRLLVWPVIDYRRALASQIEDDLGRLEQGAHLVARSEALEAQQKELQERLDREKARLLPGDSGTLAAAALQDQANQIAAERGVTLQSTTVMREEPAGAFRKVGVRLTMSGDLKSIAGMVADLELGKYHLLVPFVEMSRRGAVPGAKGPRTMSATIELNGYLAAAGKGKKAASTAGGEEAAGEGQPAEGEAAEQPEVEGEPVAGEAAPGATVPEGQPAEAGPAGEQPAGEQPAGEQPTAEQPAAEQPATEQPSAAEPSGEQPTGEQPTGEQPTGEQPTAEQPATEQPPAEEQRPADGQPEGGEATDAGQGAAAGASGAPATPPATLGAAPAEPPAATPSTSPPSPAADEPAAAPAEKPAAAAGKPADAADQAAPPAAGEKPTVATGAEGGR